ncbi:MAG: FG-GAP-like repeat-containing protein [Candidatus Magnetominusculus sp. LBB02]|nr:FG-GAP-like repeat-containing protein [Candidatus Magnetominusculus sp. LBB02]
MRSVRSSVCHAAAVFVMVLATLFFSIQTVYAAGSFTLTINKNGQSVGSVWSEPNGIDCGSMCKNPYSSGTVVTLKAIPTLESRFDGWSGCDSVSSDDALKCVMTMSADKTVTATFNKSTAVHVNLAISKSGDGSGMIQSYPPGMDCGSKCKDVYPQGAKVRLMPMPYQGSLFAGWSGCDNNSTVGPSSSPPPNSNPNECVVNQLMSDQTVTAKFIKSANALMLNVNKAGDGGGQVMSNPPGMECGSICNGPYPNGAVTVLMAKADPLSSFVGWDGCDSDNGNTGLDNSSNVSLCRVTMSADNKTVTAKFMKNTTPGITLGVHTAGSGTGTITSLPSGISCASACAATYDQYTLVTLTATADSNSLFSRWSGCDNSDNSTSAKCKVTLTSSKLVTATFTGSGAVTHKVIHDFDGDGKSDILWHNQDTGNVVLWLMDTATVKSFASVGSVSLDWQISAVGDFDGDGKTDILWKNTKDGSLHIWFMNGLTIASHKDLSTIGSDWDIKAVGDFNGDGIADLLFINKANRDKMVIWSMNGADFIDARFIAQNVASGWEVAGVADFDGDGKDDILFRNESLGLLAVWLMNGQALKTATMVSPLTDPQWRIVRVGDFDGDGKADILYKNVNTGDIAIWFMYGSTVDRAKTVATVKDSNWQIIRVGDFDGDGMLDILWQNISTGQLYVWFMNGATIKSQASLGAVSDPNWFVLSNERVQVSPANLTIASKVAGMAASFTVSGGEMPYAFNVSAPDLVSTSFDAASKLLTVMTLKPVTATTQVVITAEDANKEPSWAFLTLNP